MTPDPQVIAAIEDALDRARNGEIRSVMIAALTPSNVGALYSNMSNEEIANTIDWVSIAVEGPPGEVFTYAIH